MASTSAAANVQTGSGETLADANQNKLMIKETYVADTTSSFGESIQKVKNVPTENSTLTYFQKINNALDDHQKKVNELEAQSVKLRKNAMAHLLKVLNSVKAADVRDAH